MRALLVALLLAGCVPAVSGGGVEATRVGPARGYLIAAGGGNLRGTGILERFLELAGGPTAEIVVIPTAAGEASYSPDWAGLDLLREAGASNLTLLHTMDPQIADSDEFVRALRAANGVWIAGGRQWRLAEAYLDTRVHREIEALLERGGVVGGSSAGASILASYLVRGAREGNHVIMAPENDRGFALLRGTAIDQHLLARGRERDLLEVVEHHPEILGIGIDESTAIVVQADTFDVVGHSQVAIYDGSPLARSTGYYLLRSGDRYDMRARAPID